MNYQRTMKLNQAFTACEARFKESKLDAERLAKAIEDRMRDDEAQRDSRMAALIAQRDDPNQPPTLRRLAEIDLGKLEVLEIQPSIEEVELFRDLLDEQRQCCRDLKALQRDFREAYDDTMEDLKACRAAVLGSHTADMGGQWVSTLEQRFARLAGGVHHG